MERRATQQYLSELCRGGLLAAPHLLIPSQPVLAHNLADVSRTVSPAHQASSYLGRFSHGFQTLCVPLIRTLRVCAGHRSNVRIVLHLLIGGTRRRGRVHNLIQSYSDMISAGRSYSMIYVIQEEIKRRSGFVGNKVSIARDSNHATHGGNCSHEIVGHTTRIVSERAAVCMGTDDRPFRHMKSIPKGRLACVPSNIERHSQFVDLPQPPAHRKALGLRAFTAAVANQIAHVATESRRPRGVGADFLSPQLWRSG